MKNKLYVLCRLLKFNMEELKKLGGLAELNSVIKNPESYLLCEQCEEHSLSLIASNSLNIQYVNNISEKVFAFAVKNKNYNKIIEIYGSVKNKSEEINMMMLSYLKYKDIFGDLKMHKIYSSFFLKHIYRSINNKTENMYFDIIDNISTLLIVDLFKLFENPTDNIITRLFRMTPSESILTLHELVPNPSDIVKLITYIKCDDYGSEKYYYTKNYKSANIPDFSIEILTNFIDININIIESSRYSSDDKIKIILNRIMRCYNCDIIHDIKINSNVVDVIVNYSSYRWGSTSEICDKLISLIDEIDEKTYLKNYYHLHATKLHLIKNPSEDFLVEIVKKKWSNLQYIDKKYQTNKVCNAAKTQNIFSCIYIK